MAMRKYGFIGLGSQGAPMARRMIDSGLPTILWARRTTSLEPFSDTDAEFAQNVAELGESVDYVGVCVVDDAGTRDICGQLITSMRPGGFIVIHSTVTPQLCKELAVEAAAQGLHLVDAPVSGGGHAAADRSLAVMVGGDSAVVATIRPVLETFSGRIFHLGSVGAGQHAKLVNNAMMAANLAIAWHGLEAAGRLGIDRGAFVDLVQVSSGRSFSFDVCARLPAPQAFEHGAKLLAKDVGLLGETLGEETAYAVIRAAARSFLDKALGK